MGCNIIYCQNSVRLIFVFFSADDILYKKKYNIIITILHAGFHFITILGVIKRNYKIYSNNM